MQNVSITIHWFLLKLSIAFDIFLHLGWSKMSKRKKKVIIISRGAGNGLWSCRFLAFREIVFKKSEKTFEEEHFN